jgi:hypothetical protein
MLLRILCQNDGITADVETARVRRLATWRADFGSRLDALAVDIEVLSITTNALVVCQDHTTVGC